MEPNKDNILHVSQPPESQTPANRQIKWPLVIVVSVVVAGLLALSYFVFIHKDASGDSEGQSTASKASNARNAQISVDTANWLTQESADLRLSYKYPDDSTALDWQSYASGLKAAAGDATASVGNIEITVGQPSSPSNYKAGVFSIAAYAKGSLIDRSSEQQLTGKVSKVEGQTITRQSITKNGIVGKCQRTVEGGKFASNSTVCKYTLGDYVYLVDYGADSLEIANYKLDIQYDQLQAIARAMFDSLEFVQ